MNSRGGIFERKGSPYFWVTYYRRGKDGRAKEVRERARHIRTGEYLEVSDKNRREAERFRERRLKELAAEQIAGRPFIGPQQERVTVGELLDSLESYYRLQGKWSVKTASCVKSVRDKFGTWRAAGITPDVLEGYILALREEDYSNATINRRMQLLEQAFNIGKRKDKILVIPSFEGLRLSEKGNVRQGYPTETQFAAIIQNLPDDLRDFTSWCAITGMRFGEAIRLRWSMVNGNELQIPATICKNAIARTLPLNAFAEIAAIIERRKAARTVEMNGTAQMSEFIFHRGGEIIGEFRKSWKTACKKAERPGLLFHDLRRFAGHNLINAGVPISTAMLWTGHKTISMFLRYAILLDKKGMEGAAAQVEEYRREVAASEQSNLVAMR